MKNNHVGLDVGTNSIGWAVVKTNEEEKLYEIAGMGSRIIPMDAGEISDFDTGNLVSATAVRRGYRSTRRLRERHLLRRERLHRILNILEFLPPHYASEIDFENRYGQFFPDKELKIAYIIHKETGKYEFYFKQAFSEMLADFTLHHPALTKDGKKVPYDWTIYYLRKKALSHKISKEELAWLILHFNKKRGYSEQRGEEEDSGKIEEYHTLKVEKVIDTQEKNKKGETIYRILFDNGWEEERSSRVLPDWEETLKEYIVTSTETKNGEIKRSFRIPKEDDWNLIKKKTEKEIEDSGKTTGCFIYDTLLANPEQKIKGRLIQTIDRSNYRSELNAILKKQAEFHPELTDNKLYEACIFNLYPHNEQHRSTLKKRDMIYLLIDDIIFYQRPLKSNKSQIADCQYEYREYTHNGERKKEYLKCVPKSHPLFEEFRLWHFLKKVRIKRIADEQDVTTLFLPDEESYTNLFDKLKVKKDISQKSFLAAIKSAKLKDTEYTWNYGERTQPACPTHTEFLKRLKDAGIEPTFLSGPVEEHLWHILYSVSDKTELQKALKSFAIRYHFPDTDKFVMEFSKIKPFDNGYGSYSYKAVKKLLPLMRIGKYWKEEAIDTNTKTRIHKIIDGEPCNTISDRVREKVKKELGSKLTPDSFKGLPHWLACYVVYGRHSESGTTNRWELPEDIDIFLKNFKQHSLRNPIVERVITETLRVVRDIWKQYGDITQIHIELGREMKNPKEKRIRITRQNAENEDTNLRIRALLTELKNEGLQVRPESLSHQEKLKIFEEGALGSENVSEEIVKITRQKKPTQSEITRYRCWLEQGYCSPYTGKVISLSRLFTSDYDIEHIIPQARYYDNSFSNKIICESAVNKDKSNMLACEYIRKKGGSKIELGNGEKVSILPFEEYENLVKRNFRNAPFKKKKLLMDEIPDSFIERQMNDTRYISRYVKDLLSNIVREEGEQEATPKNIITVTGAITAKLKEDWGLNNVWNRMITPRFVRLNDITQSDDFGYWKNKYTFKIQVPEDFQRGFTKKRIDHRHHAMDALAIACTNCSHVKYLNNQSAKSENIETRNELKHKLCDKNKQNKWLFTKPWPTFTEDAQTALENTLISFKQNLRIINNSTNKYYHYENGEKQLVRQTKGQNRAIRKPLHKETFFGKVSLQYKKTVPLSTALNTWEQIADKSLRSKIRQLIADKYDKKRIIAYFKSSDYRYHKKDISKVEVYYYTEGKNALVATRKSLDKDFNAKKIESVTDSGIRKILSRHLEKYDNKPEEAFSPDGIEQMNKNIRELNEGKPHKPIFKVRVSEALGTKFPVGSAGNKKTKYVEAAQGTNLFFAIYISEDKKRSFETIPLNIAIENLKQGLSVAPEINGKGDRLLFILSPNDLVYIPTQDQLEQGSIDMKEVEKNKDRIYKMVSATGYSCFFIPYYVASSIVPTTELGANNKSERMWSGEMIKETGIKIQVNRLGQIITIKP
ncbi:MAG: type II CRISPR RNA-guided endonuclease Cas9 [Candidatus Azobacteroides sp.]|nr:type II CRISPR RNA-guided endonuclease Cas9 [Candidatus Azobacteroides sp.]